MSQALASEASREGTELWESERNPPELAVMVYPLRSDSPSAAADRDLGTIRMVLRGTPEEDDDLEDVFDRLGQSAEEWLVAGDYRILGVELAVDISEADPVWSLTLEVRFR